MKDESSIIQSLEDRIAVLERRVFGNEIDSKIQQNRQVVDELAQINSQVLRSVANRENVSQLMKKVEDMIEFLDLEESSQLLGGEAKANAVLAAEPIIRQMYGLIKEINLDQVNDAINSEAIRNLTSMAGELAKLNLVQVDQLNYYHDLSQKIRAIEEATSILASALTSSK